MKMETTIKVHGKKTKNTVTENIFYQVNSSIIYFFTPLVKNEKYEGNWVKGVK